MIKPYRPSTLPCSSVHPPAGTTTDTLEKTNDKTMQIFVKVTHLKKTITCNLRANSTMSHLRTDIQTHLNMLEPPQANELLYHGRRVLPRSESALGLRNLSTFTLTCSHLPGGSRRLINESDSEDDFKPVHSTNRGPDAPKADVHALNESHKSNDDDFKPESGTHEESKSGATRARQATRAHFVDDPTKSDDPVAH